MQVKVQNYRQITAKVLKMTYAMVMIRLSLVQGRGHVPHEGRDEHRERGLALHVPGGAHGGAVHVLDSP
jgi:hypothetical protein